MQTTQLKAELMASRKELNDLKSEVAGRMNGLKETLEAKDKHSKYLEVGLAARPKR